MIFWPQLNSSMKSYEITESRNFQFKRDSIDSYVNKNSPLFRLSNIKGLSI